MDSSFTFLGWPREWYNWQLYRSAVAGGWILNPRYTHHVANKGIYLIPWPYCTILSLEIKYVINWHILSFMIWLYTTYIYKKHKGHWNLASIATGHVVAAWREKVASYNNRHIFVFMGILHNIITWDEMCYQLTYTFIHDLIIYDLHI